MNARSRYKVRALDSHDAEFVAQLFADYMAETLNFAPSPLPLNADVIRAEGQGKKFNTMVVVDSTDVPIGFAMWVRYFDLHHAVDGALVEELYVHPKFRGRALSIRLASAIAKCVQAEGGKFLSTTVLTDDERRMKLVRRATIGFPMEQVYISERGFRQLAELEDADYRTLVRNIPKPEASREP